MQELVYDAGVDVLLLVTAPWCEACPARLYELSHLAASWAEEPRLRVATFDVGVNDLPRKFPVGSLPALAFFRANKPNEPLDLTAAASAAEMVRNGCNGRSNGRSNG